MIRSMGGPGNDKIVCGWGASNLYGEEGNDSFLVKGFPANIDGGEGIDSADFMYLPASIEVNLKDSYVLYDVATNTKSKIEYIENIRGTSFDDVIYDNDFDNVIAGGRGNDKIYLTNGDDSANGEGGSDIIYLRGGGNKQIWGGGLDADTFVVTSGFQSLNKTSTTIVDFDVGIAEDKIDLRAFNRLKKMEDLRLEQLTHDNKMFGIIGIDQEKWVGLYNVEVSKLHPSNFIFANDDGHGTCTLYDFENSLAVSNTSQIGFFPEFEI